MLSQLELPCLQDLLNEDCLRPAGGWDGIFREAIQQEVEREVAEAVRKLGSIQWIGALLSQENAFAPPSRFWPSCRYSTMGRLATTTKIKLLTGHSWLTTGVVRRHSSSLPTCPLCNAARETLEHLMYECPELAQERELSQSRYGTELRRRIPAERFILSADKQESLMIHYIYTTRVRKEVLLRTDPKNFSSNA